MATRKEKVSPQTKVDRALQRVKPVGESFQDLKILVYGNNGKGKTRFGASGPRPVLLIDCNENGSLSVRNYEDVQVFQLETWTDIDLAFWLLKQGNHEYQTVVIDTVTSLAQLCMKFVLGDEQSRDPTRDPDMPDRRAWGKVGELMRTTILNFRNLPMNVVFLAQERRGFNEDEDDSTPDVFPEVSPSVRTTLTSSVDVIGRIYVKEVSGKGEKKGSTGYEYRLLIGPSERYLTKDRSESGLPGTIRLPDVHDNLDKLVQRIKKGV